MSVRLHLVITCDDSMCDWSRTSRSADTRATMQALRGDGWSWVGPAHAPSRVLCPCHTRSAEAGVLAELARTVAL